MGSENQTKPGTFGPILCYGFAAVAAMWIVAFFAHHHAINLAPQVTAIILLFTLLAVCIFGGGAVERRRSWKVGLGAGFLSSVINLLVFGSYLAKPEAQSAGGANPSVAIELLGFLGLGTLTGLVGGITGNILESIFSAKRKELIVPVEEPDWLARFGLVAVCAAFPLLILGALVTSGGAALSVPDWPSTYGANMFLYPISLMARPRVFEEHYHRLYGAMVGLTTIALVIFTFVGGERRLWMRIWVVALLALVIIQGVLGGIRVENKSTGLALLHGVLAQVFFALLVAFAACLSPMFKNRSLARGAVTSRRAKIVVTALLHSTLVQLVFGAMYRHMGSPHALYSHIGFSLVVVIAAMLSGFALRTLLDLQLNSEWNRPRQWMRIIGSALLACVSLQFLLGWAALLVVGLRPGKPILPEAEAAIAAGAKHWSEQVIPTIHQANGALLLALATLGYVWVRRFWMSPKKLAARAATPETP